MAALPPIDRNSPWEAIRSDSTEKEVVRLMRITLANLASPAAPLGGRVQEILDRSPPAAAVSQILAGAQSLKVEEKWRVVPKLEDSPIPAPQFSQFCSRMGEIHKRRALSNKRSVFEVLSFDTYDQLVQLQSFHPEMARCIKRYCTLFLQRYLSRVVEVRKEGIARGEKWNMPEMAFDGNPLLTQADWLTKLRQLQVEVVTLVGTRSEAASILREFRLNIEIFQLLPLHPVFDKMINKYSISELAIHIESVESPDPLETLEDIADYATFLRQCFSSEIVGALDEERFSALIPLITQLKAKPYDTSLQLQLRASLRTQVERTTVLQRKYMILSEEAGRANPKEARLLAARHNLPPTYAQAQPLAILSFLIGVNTGLHSLFLNEFSTMLEERCFARMDQPNYVATVTLVKRLKKNVIGCADLLEKPRNLEASLIPHLPPFSSKMLPAWENIVTLIQRDVGQLFQALLQEPDIHFTYLSQHARETLLYPEDHTIFYTLAPAIAWETLLLKFHTQWESCHRRHFALLTAFLEKVDKHELAVHKVAYVSFIEEFLFRTSLPLAYLHLMIRDVLFVHSLETQRTLLSNYEELFLRLADYASAQEIAAFCDNLLMPAPSSFGHVVEPAPTPPVPPAAAAAPTVAPKNPSKVPVTPAPLPPKKAAPKVAVASPAAPFPIPKSGDNREKYIAKLKALGWAVHTPTSGSHHTAVSPAGEKMTIAVGGDRKEFGGGMVGRMKRKLRPRGLPR